MYCLIISLILLLDQISKNLARGSLRLGESVPVIKNFFHLSLVYNTGAAFGLFRNQTIFFISAAGVAIIAIVRTLKFKIFYSHDFKLETISLVLILSGAIGNLIDRLRFGYVVDFIDFRVWPVFNIADSSITIGACLLILSLLKSPSKNR